MVRFSVNINKLATLRNSRDKNLPNLMHFAKWAIELGVHGITVHPRPDGRHIRDTDLDPLRLLISEKRAIGQDVEFNIEGYPSSEFVERAIGLKPDQVTLVPDPPEALTSNAGWKFAANESLLNEIVKRFHAAGIRTSLFLDVATFDDAEMTALQKISPMRVELYTEAYADSFGTPEEDTVVNLFACSALKLAKAGFGINAGHDLSQRNLRRFLESVRQVAEVSIGHAVICESLEHGFADTIHKYLEIVDNVQN